MGCRQVLIALVVALATPVGVRGQRLGTEFQVNTTTANDQDYAALCHDAAGNFVVVWESEYQDGDYEGIFAQRYNSAGMPIGTEFQVNTYTTGFQEGPAVCCDDAGNFVVVWESEYQDGNYDGIFARRYDSAGTPISSEFQVNTYTTGSQQEPDVCCGASGDFVVTWESNGQDGNQEGIFARRYNSAGMPVGTEFQVNTYTTDDQANPAVCCDDAGNFVVVWESYSQDGGGTGVFGQRYNSGGAAQGTEFQVNTHTTGDQYDPDLCCAANGNFVVVWTSDSQDGSDVGVFGQRFASGGALQGTEFQVNSYTNYYQLDAEVCCGGMGNFVVAWVSSGDGDSTGVFGRRYSSSGAPQSTEFQVNTYTTSSQEDPDLSCDAAGNFVVAWESENQDGNDEGVFAQRFAAALLQTPALSWLGLGTLVLALIATAARALRRLL